MTLKATIAVLYIAYGLIKLIVGVSLMKLPEHILAKIPVVNWFTAEASDKTLAGRFYGYALMAFGCFTIIHGLAMLHVLSDAVHDAMEHRYTQYIVFTIIGVAMTLFYALVLYTNLPISKSRKATDMTHYKILGLYGGISFLVMPLLWEIIDRIFPMFDKLSMEAQNAAIIGVTVIVAIAGESLYVYLKKQDIAVTTLVPGVYTTAYERAKSTL